MTCTINWQVVLFMNQFNRRVYLHINDMYHKLTSSTVYESIQPTCVLTYK